jgi:hypothetical protein
MDVEPNWNSTTDPEVGDSSDDFYCGGGSGDTRNATNAAECSKCYQGLKATLKFEADIFYTMCMPDFGGQDGADLPLPEFNDTLFNETIPTFNDTKFDIPEFNDTLPNWDDTEPNWNDTKFNETIPDFNETVPIFNETKFNETEPSWNDTEPNWNDTKFNDTEFDEMMTECGDGAGNLTKSRKAIVLCEQCYNKKSYLKYYSADVNYTYCEVEYDNKDILNDTQTDQWNTSSGLGQNQEPVLEIDGKFSVKTAMDNNNTVTVDVLMPPNSWLGLTLGKVAMNNVDMVIFTADKSGKNAKVVDA